MTDNADCIDIIMADSGFAPLHPVFAQLGYDAAAVYIADDYPDRMTRADVFGAAEAFPAEIALGKKRTLLEEAKARLRGMPGLMIERLFSRDRDLGVVAAVGPDRGDAEARRAFADLARSVSVMAYVERIRTNDRRERQEREIFFAQSLTNRLLIREAPRLKELKLGFEFVRSLEAGGHFFDFIPLRDDGLLGFIGCCNGKGPRTVLEVTGIMRTIHRALHKAEDLAGVLSTVNDYLVHEKRRAHQASLAVFRVDPGARALTVAKSGQVDMLLCGPGTATRDISTPGAMFLGMMDEPGIHCGEYEFRQGQALFCVTEGLYAPDECEEAQARPRWFVESVATALEARRRKPLVNAIFDSVNGKRGQASRPDDALLAVSVEFAGRNRESMRLKPV